MPLNLTKCNIWRVAKPQAQKLTRAYAAAVECKADLLSPAAARQAFQIWVLHFFVHLIFHICRPEPEETSAYTHLHVVTCLLAPGLSYRALSGLLLRNLN